MPAQGKSKNSPGKVARRKRSIAKLPGKKLRRMLRINTRAEAKAWAEKHNEMALFNKLVGSN